MTEGIPCRASDPCFSRPWPPSSPPRHPPLSSTVAPASTLGPRAVDRMLATFPATIDLGLVAIGPNSTGGGCNYSAETKQFVKDYRNQMAWSVAP